MERKYRKVENIFSSNRKRNKKKNDKDGSEKITSDLLIWKCIESARFMASLLSNLSDNLAEEFHKIKCKDCNCFLEYESINDNLIKHKSLCCNKNYSNKIDEKSKKWFENTLKFSNNSY